VAPDHSGQSPDPADSPNSPLIEHHTRCDRRRRGPGTAHRSPAKPGGPSGTFCYMAIRLQRRERRDPDCTARWTCAASRGQQNKVRPSRQVRCRFPPALRSSLRSSSLGSTKSAAAAPRSGRSLVLVPLPSPEKRLGGAPQKSWRSGLTVAGAPCSGRFLCRFANGKARHRQCLACPRPNFSPHRGTRTSCPAIHALAGGRGSLRPAVGVRCPNPRGSLLRSPHRRATHRRARHGVRPALTLGSLPPLLGKWPRPPGHGPAAAKTRTPKSQQPGGHERGRLSRHPPQPRSLRSRPG